MLYLVIYLWIVGGVCGIEKEESKWDKIKWIVSWPFAMGAALLVILGYFIYDRMHGK